MSEIIQPHYAELIARLRPNAEHIEYLGSGDINDVVLVGNEVFRFPKNEQGRDSLRYEEAILRLLSHTTTLQIPEVQTVADDASYGIFTHLPGHTLTLVGLRSLPDYKKQQVGQQIARFMVEIDTALSLEQVAELWAKYLPWREDESTYYQTKLNRGVESPYHTQYVDYYQQFLDRLRQVGQPREFVSHGDIWVGNMLFDDDRQLTGIIDFGDTGPVTAYNELRQMYRMGEDLVRIIIDKLDGHFGEIDIAAVRLNAIMHEFSVLMRPESQSWQLGSRAELAHTLLTQWLGEGWEEQAA